MKNKIRFLPLIGILLIMQITFAQKITLPYQEIGGVPIVKVIINGEDHNFIFDTGSTQTIIDSTLSKNLRITDSSVVIDIYGKKKQLTMVRLDNLKIGQTIFKPIKASVHNFNTSVKIRNHRLL